MKKDIKETGNAHYIHKLNTIKILHLIRNHGEISRAEIAEQSGLSAPTVSRIVEQLLHDGLVNEIGTGASRGGRRPTLLRFSGEDNYVIGIDLGTTNIYGVLADLNARFIAEVKRPTRVEDGFSGVMQRTSEVIKELKGHLKQKRSQIFGIGMAVAGLINRERNIVEFSPDFHWHNVDVIGELSSRHDIPIILDNVTRVMALGELWYGIGRKIENFICINVGYGIGAGIIIQGRPLYGPTGMAGEFGHFTIDKDSRIQCNCGNFGCLEALSSGNAIAKAAQNQLKPGTKTILKQMSKGDLSRIDAKMVVDAAKQGDAYAWNIFNQAAEYLGVGIAGLVNLFSPEAVVIGGGVAQSGDILFDKVRKIVNARALKKIAREVIIEPATFGTKSAVMGALSLILREILNLNFKNHNY
jgi:glucokinase-like ROK family protein